MVQKFHSGIVGALLKSITLLKKHLTGAKGAKFHWPKACLAICMQP